MFSSRPSIEECERVGRARFEQLLDVRRMEPKSVGAALLQLPWVRLDSPAEHAIQGSVLFHLLMGDLLDVLIDVVANQRGPAILGYLDHLVLNSSVRFEASYSRGSRVVRLSAGLVLVINELEALCDWIESLLMGRQLVTIREALAVVPPPAVLEELQAFFRLGTTGELPMSGKLGLRRKLAIALVRFVFVHELSHLIDDAESSRLQTSWRNAVWLDYQQALRCAGPQYARLARETLPPDVADRWVAELVADGLAFYTLASIKAPNPVARRGEYVMLQAGTELFFAVLRAIYHGDLGTDWHPPLRVRSWVLRAQHRKERQLPWPEFLSQVWGPGYLTAELVDRAIREAWPRDEG